MKDHILAEFKKIKKKKKNELKIVVMISLKGGKVTKKNIVKEKKIGNC